MSVYFLLRILNGLLKPCYHPSSTSAAWTVSISPFGSVDDRLLITSNFQTFGTFHLPSSWAWRIPSALQGLPSVIQVGLIWFVPESPRWLVSKGRYVVASSVIAFSLIRRFFSEEEALRTLAYYHANGNAQDPLVEFEFEEIRAAINLDREAAANVGWMALFKSPGNRRRLRIIIALAFFSQWSGNGLV